MHSQSVSEHSTPVLSSDTKSASCSNPSDSEISSECSSLRKKLDYTQNMLFKRFEFQSSTEESSSISGSISLGSCEASYKKNKGNILILEKSSP